MSKRLDVHDALGGFQCTELVCKSWFPGSFGSKRR